MFDWLKRQLRKRKLQCAVCKQWKQDTLMRGDWCCGCLWQHQEQIALYIGIVLTARCGSLQEDINDVVQAATRALQQMPNSEVKIALSQALCLAKNVTIEQDGGF